MVTFEEVFQLALTETADLTRANLLRKIRLAHGGWLPFAFPLGHEDDGDVPWVQLETATDDQLRMYIAHNYARALMEE